MPRLTFNPQNPRPTVIKTCVSCRHHYRDSCKLYGTVCLITGNVEYAHAYIIREQYCQGEHYEYEKKLLEKNSQQES
jgi:hypothetical protein